jgi:Uma2 family endonuclease
MSAVIGDVDVVYPESDGKPMADNTLQWDWIVRIVSELREVFAGQTVFVAGDLFWYPVRGNPRIVTAPDAVIAFGRPAGYRGSYKQWEEDNVAPQVVFEILSPNNTEEEMESKFLFYERHGVEEYYVIDPDEPTAYGYFRREGTLVPITRLSGYVSPRLGIRFELSPEEVHIFTPSGRPFQDRTDRVREIEEELRRTTEAIDQERLRAVEAEREAAVERTRNDALRTRLRELGVDPDDINR